MTTEKTPSDAFLDGDTSVDIPTLPAPPAPPPLAKPVVDLPPSPVEEKWAERLASLPATTYRHALHLALLTRPAKRTPEQRALIAESQDQSWAEARWYLDRPGEEVNAVVREELLRYAAALPGEEPKVKALLRIVGDGVAPPPAAPSPASSPPALRLTELQVMEGQMLGWRWRALRAQASLARDRAQAAAVAEANAHEASMGHYARLGVDTTRAFEILPDGTVAYQEEGRPSSADPSEPRYEYAPAPGQVVKRCGGCKDKGRGAPAAP